MIRIEYDIIITLELATNTEEEQKDAYKRFKHKLWEMFGDMGEAMITNITKGNESTQRSPILYADIL